MIILHLTHNILWVFTTLGVALLHTGQGVDISLNHLMNPMSLPQVSQEISLSSMVSYSFGVQAHQSISIFPIVCSG